MNTKKYPKLIDPSIRNALKDKIGNKYSKLNNSILSVSSKFWKESVSIGITKNQNDDIYSKVSTNSEPSPKNQDIYLPPLKSDESTKLNSDKCIIETPSPENINSNFFFERKSWTPLEEKKLINLANFQVGKNWKLISEIIGNKTPQQCSYKYQKLNSSSGNVKWTRLEDIKLMELIEIHGHNWEKLSNILQKPKDLIEDRYYNKLDPFLKRSKFTDEEDQLIINLHSRFGNKWNEITKFLPNRNSSMIKNRYYSFIRKRINNFNTNDKSDNYYSISHSPSMKSFSQDLNCLRNNLTNLNDFQEDSRGFYYETDYKGIKNEKNSGINKFFGDSLNENRFNMNSLNQNLNKDYFLEKLDINELNPIRLKYKESLNLSRIRINRFMSGFELSHQINVEPLIYDIMVNGECSIELKDIFKTENFDVNLFNSIFEVKICRIESFCDSLFQFNIKLIEKINFEKELSYILCLKDINDEINSLYIQMSHIKSKEKQNENSDNFKFELFDIFLFLIQLTKVKVKIIDYLNDLQQIEQFFN